jgi:hypothetical protein
LAAARGAENGSMAATGASLALEAWFLMDLADGRAEGTLPVAAAAAFVTPEKETQKRTDVGSLAGLLEERVPGKVTAAVEAAEAAEAATQAKEMRRGKASWKTLRFWRVIFETVPATSMKEARRRAGGG